MQLRTRFLILLVGLAQIAHAQTSRFPPINLYNGDPTGNVCTSPLIQQSSTNGKVYSCQSGHMNLISGAAFDGGVVTNPITAPSYTLAGCPAGQVIKGDGTGCVALTAGTAAGSNTQLQYNNGGNFGATTWTWDGAYMNSAADLPAGHQLASANAAVTTYSVLAFGAKADRLSGFAVSMTASSATMTCASCSFTSADAGKYVTFPGWTAQPFSAISFTPKSSWTPTDTAKILSITDPTHVVLNKTALNSFTSTSMAYGTDNSPAFNACSVFVNALGGGTCKIPGGQYLLGTADYYSVMFVKDDGSYGTPAGGSGAVITATLGSGATAGQIVSYAISNGGSGYTPLSKLAITVADSSAVCAGGGYNIGPCGGVFAYAHTNSSGVVDSVLPFFNGFGLTSAPTLTVTAMGGDGASAHVTVAAGAINASVIDTAGAGYGGNFDVFGVGGTNCVAIGGLQNVSGVTITAQGTAIVTAGAVTSLTWSNPGSGCTGAPTVLFGDYTCGNPLTSQCANVAPLDPFILPVQMLLTSNVTWEGPSAKQGGFGQAASINGVWDAKTVDNNQPALFGTNRYVKNQSINGLVFDHTFIGILSPFSGATSVISNNTFGTTAIGIYLGATDLGLQMIDNTFFGYAAYVGGGQWNTRTDSVNILGGFYNSEKIENPIVFASPHNAVSIATDDWFANNFWHPEFSAANTDFLETCSFPQSPNQRQTSNIIKFGTPSNTTGNTLCYPGITGSGIVELARNEGGSISHNITNLGVKSCYRYLYYGAFAGGEMNGAYGCEGGTTLATDPYRTAATQRGAIVIPNGSAALATTSIKNVAWTTSGSISQLIWGVGSATGIPVCSSSQLSCGAACATTPNSFSGSNVQGNLNVTQTTTTGKVVTTGNAAALFGNFPAGNTGPQVLSNCPSGVSICAGTQPTWNTNGVYYAVIENPVTPSADIFDLYAVAPGLAELYTLAADGGITNTGANVFKGSVKFGASGTAVTGNQGTGVLVQHSTGALTSGNFIKADASGNAVDSGIPATATVADTTITIASFAIPANTCYGSAGSTTPATVSMTNLTTAMSVIPGYSSNPTAITGWGTVGGLNLIIWPSSANTASYCVNNSTAGSITGGAITFNLVAR